MAAPGLRDTLGSLLLVFSLAAPLSGAATSATAPDTVYLNASSIEDMLEQLAIDAPQLNRIVLERALEATSCAIRLGIAAPQRLAVIDYSLPSTANRLWIFDLHQRELILHDLVAHGRNSGDLNASAFSNISGSLQSSLGLFQGDEEYSGAYGYSLRLDGLEPGINDLARDRAIVIHGAEYVDPSWITAHGRIGRSHGCPAVRRAIADQVVDNLKEGQLVFAYYPDQNWLATSSFFNCENAVSADRKIGAVPNHK